MTETTGAFDPTAHRLVAESRWFEDFTLGERFALPSRTLGEAHFLAFQAASGDNHPIHYDRPWCRARGHRDLLADSAVVESIAAFLAGGESAAGRPA